MAELEIWFTGGSCTGLRGELTDNRALADEMRRGRGVADPDYFDVHMRVTNEDGDCEPTMGEIAMIGVYVDIFEPVAAALVEWSETVRDKLSSLDDLADVLAWVRTNGAGEQPS